MIEFGLNIAPSLRQTVPWRDVCLLHRDIEEKDHYHRSATYKSCLVGGRVLLLIKETVFLEEMQERNTFITPLLEV